MIYTVELNFSDTARADEWNAWYETYLQTLVTLPGLTTAQRFRAVDPDTQDWEYLAVYSIDSLDVFETEAYRSIGGGGNASRAFKGAITRRRNVYDGIGRMAEVGDRQRLLLSVEEDAADLAELPWKSLTAATGRRQAGASQIDGTPARRVLAVDDAVVVAGLGLGAIPGIAIYVPITQRYVGV